MPVIEDFVERYGARDWDALADCFADDGFERIGPYVDVITGKDEYLAFLRRVVPAMPEGYGLTADRIVDVDDTLAFAQLTEHVVEDGRARAVPEVIIFGLDGAGRIHHMRLYLQRPGGQAPVGGRDAMGRTET